jgi:signal transduction histidine kinase
MFAQAVWLSALFMEAVVWEIPQKIFWAKIEYIGFSAAPPLIFQFAMRYTNRKLSPKLLIPLWVPPVLNIIMTWTNESHGLVWKDFFWIDRSLYLMQFVHGIWYFVFLTYFILLMITVNIIFLQEWRRSSGSVKIKFTLMGFAILVPLLFGLGQISGILPPSRVDLTPVGFILSNVLIWYALSHYNLLDLGPIAHLQLTENLPDGVVVLNQDNSIFSANPAAVRITGTALQPQQTLPPNLQDLLSHRGDPVIFDHPDGSKLYLTLTAQSLSNAAGSNIGKLIVLRNMTQLYQTELALREEVRRKAIQDERQRLARDLHDSTMQSLHSAYLLADNMKRLSGRRDTKPIEQIMASVRQALREMRLMIYQTEYDDKRVDFHEAIHERVATVEERVGIQVNLSLKPSLDIPQEWQREMIALTSEALNNIIKHSRASEVGISLNQVGKQLELVIQDNGTSFDPSKCRSGGMGLANMQKRAALMHGELQIESTPGHGTCIRLTLPSYIPEGVEQ